MPRGRSVGSDRIHVSPVAHTGADTAGCGPVYLELRALVVDFGL
ncbi:hypothetical protein AB0L59_23220 [Streptomyces sp. NPDC052109]